MRDPILASKFNGLQLFFCETPTVPVSLTAEFRNKDIKAFPPSSFNLGTNQCRSRTGHVANFAKRDNSILIYTPNCYHADIEFNRQYPVYLFEGTSSRFMKQKLMLCISLDDFKTNERF